VLQKRGSGTAGQAHDGSIYGGRKLEVSIMKRKLLMSVYFKTYILKRKGRVDASFARSRLSVSTGKTCEEK
jgi:hypothetical protein